MKKRIFKKAVAVLMAATMLFTTMGCSKKEDKGGSFEKKDTKDMTFEGEKLNVEGFKGDINGLLYVKDDRVYFNTGEWYEVDNGEEKETSEEEAGMEIIRFYSMKLDGTDLKEIQMPELERNEYVSSIEIDKKGNMITLVNVYDKKTEKTGVYLRKVDAEGKELLKAELTEALKLNTGDKTVGKIIMDEKENLVLPVSDMDKGSEIHIFDENFKSAGAVKTDDTIEDVAKTKDGKIICCGKEEGGSFVQELNVKNKKWGKKYIMEDRNIVSLLNGVTYDFYFSEASGIFGYDIASKKVIPILDFMASAMYPDISWEAVPISTDRMLGTTFDETGTTSFVIYKKVDPSTIADRKTITYGGICIDYDTVQAALEFNENNKEYKIEFVDYQEAENPELKMNTDFAAGRIPDIIDLSQVTIEKYVAKGLLEDLTPYLEKDSELSEDDFLPTPLEAAKTDGKLYWIAPCFRIITLVGKTSDVGKDIGWSFPDMKAVIDKKGDKARAFCFTRKSDMIYPFEYSFADYIDWNTGKCSFDSQEFKDILEFCNTGLDGERDSDEDDDTYTYGYMNGDVLFLEGWIELEQLTNSRLIYDDEVTFIGYPTKDKSGNYFQFNQKVGISSQSDVKDGAWEFIRILLTKKYQSTIGNPYAVPTRKDSYDMYVKRKTTTETYTDEFGQIVNPLDIEGTSTWGRGMLDIKERPIVQEEVDKFNELLENTHKNAYLDYDVLDIIKEEAKRYFCGEKSLEETVKVIQKRVTTYVNEQR